MVIEPKARAPTRNAGGWLLSFVFNIGMQVENLKSSFNSRPFYVKKAMVQLCHKIRSKSASRVKKPQPIAPKNELKIILKIAHF